MTTTQDVGDNFDEIERNLDWIERLESIRAQNNLQQAAQATVGYVKSLRATVVALAADLSPADLQNRYGSGVAALIESIRDEDQTDHWLESLEPALTQQE